MDAAAILRCRPARQDREGYRDAVACCNHERTQAADRLQRHLEQRRRIVLTGTPAELVNNLVAAQGERDTIEMLDAAFGALVERKQQFRAGA